MGGQGGVMGDMMITSTVVVRWLRESHFCFGVFGTLKYI